jgi:hypothetical protein
MLSCPVGGVWRGGCSQVAGGVPSRFYTDPEEAADASALACSVIEAVARRLKETQK